MNLSDSTVYAQGRFCKYDDARVGLLSHGLNYGTGCFEGIRAFWDAEAAELNLLLATEHYARMQKSAKMLHIALPHSAAELTEITLELLARNRFQTDVYVRALAFKDDEDIGVRLHDVKDSFALIAIPFGKYVDVEGALNVCVSSWRRMDDASAPARAKITGIYVNSALAKSEALQNGFDEAIMLSADGHVSEGSAMNIFLVRENVIITPDPAQNILEGITRGLIIKLAESLGFKVVERAIDRSELYAADEIFFTGTGAGVLAVKAVDRRSVGSGEAGPITLRLIHLYERVVRAKEPTYKAWLRPVYAGRAATAR